MTVQEIFNQPSVREVECEILRIETEANKTDYLKNCEERKAVFRELLRLRKRLLDSMFVMDENYAKLLDEFKKALQTEIAKVKGDMVEAYNAAKASGLPGNIEVEAQCYLNYQYTKLHPIQTMRAKKMWDILNGCLDSYSENYKYGVDGFNRFYHGGEIDKTEMIVSLDQDCFKSFSIFDLLWIRNFDVELYVRTTQYTHEPHKEDPELNWDKTDYYDD